MEKHKITYQDQTISYTINRKKVKNINLQVKPDSTVVVSAHSKVSLTRIEEFVKSKAPWIQKNIKHFERLSELKASREYLDGEEFLFLGQVYTLQVIYDKTKREEVIHDHGKLLAFVNDDSDYQRKKTLLEKWYRKQATLNFDWTVDKILSLMNEDKLTKPSITIRTMKSRWGSCSWQKQKITLNTILIKAPQSCIDYVVLHELTHFVHRRHDASFYSYIAAIMPDWKERRKTLKELAYQWL